MTHDSPPLEVWGGVECTVNRVGDRWFDQLAWSGHDTRVDDLERFAALGIRTLRFPLLWERMAPDNLDHIDWRWADERLNCIRDLEIRPIVGLLHHGSGPSYTSLLDVDFPTKLARFAGAVSERYPWITDFTPINEPLTTARFSGLYGHWYPHRHADGDFVQVLLNQVRAIVLAMRAVRRMSPSAQLIQTEDCGGAFGTSVTRDQVEHECHRRWLTWDLLCGHVTDAHPLRAFLRSAGMTDEDDAFFVDNSTPPDVLGLNYYVTSDRYLDDGVDRYPEAAHGGNGRLSYVDSEAVRARPEGIVGHAAHLLAAWKRYGIPVAITEAHLGCTRDEQMRWLFEAWRGAWAARAGGADVRAVTAWALLGSFNWDSLVTRDAGHYEPGAFDVRGPEPRVTALATVVRTLASGNEPDHPVLAGTPWWHRRPGTRLAGREPWSMSPVLIIGSTGTLGRAFHRICQTRGLAAQLVGRQDVDITDAPRVDAILRRLQPWAVINAAGFVRVDQAEGEPEVCYRANVTGAVNLAAACRRRGVPFVTFSSDLVFDGSQAFPYVEPDEPAPLNVYGRTKAEAERRVLALLPEALVIRTSAFFGPWDDYNFVARVLKTIDDGATVAAPTDSIVSPTYVPDLVHAALDLLIDGERGLWHVVNGGAVSWFDLARMAAAQSGRPVDRINPTETSQVWGPAVRPRYSALTTGRGQLLRPLADALEAYFQDADIARRATATGTCV